MINKKINKDCKYFKGYKPCKYNKEYGIECENCDFYKPFSHHILIIKLAGIGDVIRTTPILRRLKSLYPDVKIWWLTEYPEILSKEVDCKIKFDFKGIEIIKSINFGSIYNLDKSPEACTIMGKLSAIVHKGFRMNSMYGVIEPIDSNANHKYLTGLFDNVSKENKKHYVEEIFEICDIGKFEGEEYLLSEIIPKECLCHPTSRDSDILLLIQDFKEGKKIVGLNIGCGDRWKSREWKRENWILLSRSLIRKGYEVVILGGEKEHVTNKYIAERSGAKYYGTFPIDIFSSIVNICDIVVSSVTSTMHIAIGLKKKVVVLNNIFNKNEFYLYNRGKIVEPEIECDCYYSEYCKNDCINKITVDKVLQTVEELL